ncbi:MAG: hypothetical protein AB1489_02470 [Acidobacteriota bacterium]
MSEEENRKVQTAADQQLDFATAQSTYKIITALVEHIDAASSLIAVMASALGEEPTRRLTQTVAWAEYLQARRTLEALRPELERFAVTVTKIAESQPPISNGSDK